MERNEYRSFFVTNQEIKNPLISLIDYPLQQKVWCWLLENCCTWNSVLGLQTRIAKEAKGSRVKVCSSLKELENKGYIIKDGKDGTTNRYFINPHYIWKGEAKDHRLAIAKWDKIQQRKQEDRNEF
jgi:predicted transcriptional regulator